MSQNYHFRAKAVAISGSITRPVEHELGEMAVTELVGGKGGYRSLRLDKHRVHEILSFDAAYTQVTGSEGPDGTFHTLAVATVENLNVLDILKVERITARLVGMHCQADFESCPHPWIIPLGSEIVNLRVAGREIPVDHPPGFHLDPQNHPKYADWTRQQQRPHHPGESIEVPRFGTLRHCRLVVEPAPVVPGSQPHQLHRLCMLQICLASPVDGTVDVATIDEDGSPPDPPPTP